MFPAAPPKGCACAKKATNRYCSASSSYRMRMREKGEVTHESAFLYILSPLRISKPNGHSPPVPARPPPVLVHGAHARHRRRRAGGPPPPSSLLASAPHARHRRRRAGAPPPSFPAAGPCSSAPAAAGQPRRPLLPSPRSFPCPCSSPPPLVASGGQRWWTSSPLHHRRVCCFARACRRRCRSSSPRWGRPAGEQPLRAAGPAGERPAAAPRSLSPAGSAPARLPSRLHPSPFAACGGAVRPLPCSLRRRLGWRAEVVGARARATRASLQDRGGSLHPLAVGERGSSPCLGEGT